MECRKVLQRYTLPRPGEGSLEHAVAVSIMLLCVVALGQLVALWARCSCVLVLHKSDNTVLQHTVWSAA